MKKGFSLIELMVVVVIIGILAAIAIPNFIRLKDRAKDSEVKSNAHTLQIALEDYAALCDGMYPANFGDLDPNAISDNIKNPFTGGFGVNNCYLDGAASNTEGFCDYDHANYDAAPYTIYACGKDGNEILTLYCGQ